jgi:hypothetical protein
MRAFRKLFVTFLVGGGIFGIALNSSSVFQAGQTSAHPTDSQTALLRDFAGMNPIDVHVHVFKNDPVPSH